WQELGRDMEKMHAGMRSIKPSGNSDIDFARLMLPHHQAAIDMAKTELVYGKDPQMRRLAQEIIIDQQSETQLMQLWLKDHQIDSPNKNRIRTSRTRRLRNKYESSSLLVNFVSRLMRIWAASAVGAGR